MCRWNFS